MAARKRQKPNDDLVDRIKAAARTRRCSRAYHEAAEALARAARGTRMVDPDQPVWIRQYEEFGSFVFALGQLLVWFESWRRPPHTWSPPNANARACLASLARHLLCDYAPPGCFESAWINPDGTGEKERRWFVSLGIGASVRELSGPPAKLTRRAAHLLGEAPPYLTISEAVRWAEYRSMGAGETLAGVLVSTLSRATVNDEAFRLELARWFIAEPGIRPGHVGPIADYVNHRRFTPVDRWNGDDWIGVAPAEPNLSMHGRTLESIGRQVDRWHAELGRRSRFGRPTRWKPCGIPGFEHAEGARRTRYWRIQELLNSDALLDESAAMHHCVSTYATRCASGQCAIYSLTAGSERRRRRQVTIEVDLETRQIVQARRRWNEAPKPDDRRIVETWAEAVGLPIEGYVWRI